MIQASRRLPVAGPWITDLEIEYVSEAARNGWYETAGEFPSRFEQAFATAVGRKHAQALPSCTAGIHLVLAALGVGPGDEVIIPDATWIASAAPVTYVGASPIFVDVDRRTWCLDPEAVQVAITPRTKAIIAVDLYGGMPDMNALKALAQAHGLALIEDAAEAIGSLWGGRAAGSFGVASVFSFHGSKTVTTGEGGMVVTDDASLLERMAVLRDHGRMPGDTEFQNAEVAYKYKMSALQAALGLAQVERLPELVAKKRQIFSWYEGALDSIDGLELNVEPTGTLNSYWMVTLVIDRSTGVSGASLRSRLFDLGIDTRPFFRPLSSLPAYAGRAGCDDAQDRNPVAYDVAPRGLNLPSALRLTEGDVDRVVHAVRLSLASPSTSSAP